ncbi:MAG: hypothetical protein JG768_1305 [Fusobacteriales bacterium]|jgi:hypothetical protein|nr:hypothetical protein [Fusobacteriales bacterium]
MQLYQYDDNSISSEIIFRNDSETIILKGLNFTNFIVNYTAKIFVISGQILINDLETKKLAKWSKISSERHEHLKDMTLRYVRNGFVVREIEMNKMYIISYDENYTTGTYTLVITQHNKKINSQYHLIPIETDCGRMYALVQPKDERTSRLMYKMKSVFKENKFRDIKRDGILVLNSAGSVAVLKATGDGIKYLSKFGFGTSISFLMRFNIYYLATHGTNLLISTSADMYFRAIGYEEGIGTINPLKDIYEEVANEAFKVYSKLYERSYNEEQARKFGEKAFYAVDLGGAVLELGYMIKSTYNSLRYGKKISFRIKYDKNFNMAFRKYRKSYITISSGAIARDINPVYQDLQEVLKDE